MIKMTDLEMRNILKGEFNEWLENFNLSNFATPENFEKKENLEGYFLKDLDSKIYEIKGYGLLNELKEDNFSLYDSLRTWDLLKELGL